MNTLLLHARTLLLATISIDITMGIINRLNALKRNFIKRSFAKRSSLRGWFFLIHLSGWLSFFCLFSSCSKNNKQGWEIAEIITKNTRFNGGKIYLSPEDDSSNLEVEISRSRAGISFYVNLLLFQAPPWKEDPSRTTLFILFEEQEPWEVHPYLLAGGQKLELPEPLAQTLIEALLNHFDFRLKIGRNETLVPSAGFTEKYQKLLEIPVDLN